MNVTAPVPHIEHKPPLGILIAYKLVQCPSGEFKTVLSAATMQHYIYMRLYQSAYNTSPMFKVIGNVCVEKTAGAGYGMHVLMCGPIKTLSSSGSMCLQIKDIR